MGQRFLFVSFLLLLLTKLLSAQVQENNINLPKIIPPSPNSASLGKFGDIPVGLATGLPSIDIPLYTITEGSLNVPVSISYHSAGVKVEEISGVVGLGWAFNAGGVITRTVRGQPDDAPSSGYFNTNQMPDPSTDSYKLNSYVPDASYLRAIANGYKDSEPDMYFFNFVGFSGKLLVDAQKNVYAAPFQNFKIQHGFGADQLWVITTDEGVKYFFGGDDAIETSYSESYCNPGTDSPPDNPYISSWYLKKIESPTGEVISFEYSIPSSTTYYSNFSETRYDLISGPSIQGYGASCEGYIYYNCNINLTVENIYLKKINWSNGTLETSLNPRTDIPGLQLVSSISIKDDKNIPIKNLQFVYSYFNTNNNNEQRLKLESVANSINNVVENKYQFLYDERSPLANRNSKAQDYWGYYNGKNSNTTLIPALYGASFGGSDRNADSIATQNGILKKIIYPTGGYTYFDYELNTFGYEQQKAVTSGDLNVPMTQSLSVRNWAGLIEDTKVITVSVNQSGLIRYNRGKRTSYSPDPPTGIIEFIKLSNGTNMLQSIPMDGNEYPISLEAGDYRMYVSAEELDNFANITVKWSDQSTFAIKVKTSGGLRIKKITDVDPVTLNTKTTDYTYNYNQESDRSSGVLNSAPKFFYNGNKSKMTNQPQVVYDCTYTIRQSAMVNQLGSTLGSPISYAEVTIQETLNNFPLKGKTINYYTTARNFQDAVSYLFPFPPNTSYEWRRGLLVKSEEYNQNNNLIKIAENIYKFNTRLTGGINFKSIPGMKVGYFFKHVIQPELDVIKYATYENIAEWYYLESTINTLYNLSGNSPVTNTVLFFYDNPLHAKQTRVVESNSKLTTSSNSYIYPQDIVLTGTEETARLNLIAKHQIGTVIENEIVSNGASRKYHTVYKTWPNGFEQPEKILTNSLSNGAFEPRLNFKNYDSKGNLLNVSQQNGSDIVYVWGYQGRYPIAEIKNANRERICFADFEFPMDNFNSATVIKDWMLPYASMSNFLAWFVDDKYTGVFGCKAPALSSKNMVLGSYTLSFQAKGNGTISINGISNVISGNWKYYFWVLPNITRVDISNTNQIILDDIKLYPSDAQMTTYTYSPLVGMTSQTDPKGKTTYYEYDEYQRLKNIKDQNGNIIKSYTYNYKQ